MDKMEASRLWKSGKTQTEIARHFGMTKGQIAGIFGRDRDMFPRKTSSFGNLETELVEVLKASLQEDEKVHSRQSANALRKMFHGATQPVRTIPSKAENESYDQSRLPHAVSLMDLDPKGCKWPLTDKPYLFCGERRYQLKPWCEHHHERAWRAQ